MAIKRVNSSTVDKWATEVSQVLRTDKSENMNDLPSPTVGLIVLGLVSGIRGIMLTDQSEKEVQG